MPAPQMPNEAKELGYSTFLKTRCFAKAAEILTQQLGKPVARHTAYQWYMRAVNDLGKPDVRDLTAAQMRDARPFIVENPPGDTDEPVDALIERRRRAFERRAQNEDASSLVRVSVQIDGPYGILHMGDPHVDDNGCNWPLLQQHIDLINDTEGLFGANVGDLTNNWIGRLARLYANQDTTAADAWRLAEWLVKSVDWLYLVGGNHDVWSGAADPLRWFAKQAGLAYKWHGVRMALTSPNGREVRINARHDFAGTSQWNGAHAPSKAARLGFHKDHIYTCGHRHAAAQNMLVWENGEHVAHALRVGTYKVFDDFADAKGFPRENLPAVVTVVNPAANTAAGLVTVFWDAEAAADYLTFLRRPRAVVVKHPAPRRAKR